MKKAAKPEATDGGDAELAEGVPGAARAIDAELVEAFRGAAFYANKALVTAGGPNVRITFMERREIGGEEIVSFRTAVVLDVDTMQKLSNILQKLGDRVVEVPLGEADA